MFKWKGVVHSYTGFYGIWQEWYELLPDELRKEKKEEIESLIRRTERVHHELDLSWRRFDADYDVKDQAWISAAVPPYDIPERTMSLLRRQSEYLVAASRLLLELRQTKEPPPPRSAIGALSNFTDVTDGLQSFRHRCCSVFQLGLMKIVYSVMSVINLIS